MTQADEDQEKTHRWLKAAGLKAETEGYIVAAQYHAGTNTTSSRSLKWTQNADCVVVSTRPLTIWSLAALNLLKLTVYEYIHRHNKAAAHMHWKICKEFGIKVKEQWYEHETKTVTEKVSITIP